MASEFLTSETSAFPPPELLPAELVAIDQARVAIAGQRTDGYRPYFSGVTTDGTFVVVDRPVDNDFAKCVIWTGNVREMAVGAEPIRHKASAGNQSGVMSAGSGPGQFGRVMTTFNDEQGGAATIEVPAGKYLNRAHRPIITNAAGSRLIFTLIDSPEQDTSSNSASMQPERVENVTVGLGQIVTGAMARLFLPWKKRKL